MTRFAGNCNIPVMVAGWVGSTVESHSVDDS